MTWEFFGGDLARSIVRAKVEALYPAHEVDKFTDHFWGMIQFWRKTEADRLARFKAAEENAAKGDGAADSDAAAAAPAEEAT